MVGDGAATLVARAFTAANCPQPPDALERFLAAYSTRLLEFTRPYPGVVQLLTDLHPRVALAVLTNKPLASTRIIMDGLDLARFFQSDRVLGGDGPLPRKPDPTSLGYLMDAARVTACETLMVGDSEIDWLTARGAGTHICLAKYGFGFEGVARGALSADDRVIDAPLELLRLL